MAVAGFSGDDDGSVEPSVVMVIKIGNCLYRKDYELILQNEIVMKSAALRVGGYECFR